MATMIGSITIDTGKNVHGAIEIHATIDGLPYHRGILTTWAHGSSYLIRDYRTGKNTHPGVRVDNAKSESELLSQMVDEMLALVD